MSAYSLEESSGPGWFEIAPGIRRKTVASGAAMMQIVVHLDTGSHLPAHSHPHEQITHVIVGRLRLVVGGTPHDLEPGDSLLIPGDITHSADTLDQAVVIDTFRPAREDMLAQDRAGAT
jgi:quercetin dioxygenase-like cupin family protein